MKTNINKLSGFTLIEVMIVIVIVGILASFTGRQFFGFTEGAKATALYETTNQIDNEIKSLGSLHGVGPSAAKGGVSKSGNSMLDVLAYGEEFVSDVYATRYKYSPHTLISGLKATKSPTDGSAGQYSVQGMPISIGTSTDKNEYIVKNVEAVVLASYINKYAENETFIEGQSGGTNGGKLAWTYSSGLYDVTIVHSFN
ncbi:prepilin-type N-terminal cleavage/methylation domain-containing protein [Vibrio fluvialis]|nr:prepilin-type N-terminal cleavage/methylation domain-containing protein [Vibrio fluvialis]